jgi:hypothetical protein
MLVDSKQQQLDLFQIATVAAQQTKAPYSPDAVIASLIVELQQPDTYSIAEGNTVFILHKGEGRNAMFRALNADIPQNYLNNSLVFAKACYQLGFDYIVTNFTEPSLMNIFRFVEKNRDKVNPDMGFAFEKNDDGEYVVTVKLGPERGGE